ncbi:MAG TPA: hypothetical protein VKA61_01945, partial [Sphingomicrobium sp.]|nr:hypothetical protein [Sphingomicrobium sp.]
DHGAWIGLPEQIDSVVQQNARDGAVSRGAAVDYHNVRHRSGSLLLILSDKNVRDESGSVSLWNLTGCCLDSPLFWHGMRDRGA